MLASAAPTSFGGIVVARAACAAWCRPSVARIGSAVLAESARIAGVGDCGVSAGEERVAARLGVMSGLPSARQKNAFRPKRLSVDAQSSASPSTTSSFSVDASTLGPLSTAAAAAAAGCCEAAMSVVTARQMRERSKSPHEENRISNSPDASKKVTTTRQRTTQRTVATSLLTWMSCSCFESGACSGATAIREAGSTVGVIRRGTPLPSVDCARPFADDCGRSGNTHPYAETSGGTQTGGFLLGIMAAVVPLVLWSSLFFENINVRYRDFQIRCANSP